MAAMSKMRWARACFPILIGCAMPAVAATSAHRTSASATFARRAITVEEIHGTARPKTLTAPDTRTRAIARFSTWKFKGHDSLLSVFVGGDDHVFPGGPDGELLWAPDSDALAVTADDAPDAADTAAGPDPSAGADQQTHFEASILVRPDHGRHWRRFDLTTNIAALFAPKMRCDDADARPDVAVIGFTSGARAVVVAQVPRSVGCADPGSFAGFIVDTATGAPLMDLSAATLRTRYRAMLGRRLMPRRHHRRHR